MQTLAYSLIWGAFIFLMMRFGCGAHVMGHGHSRRDNGGKLDDPGTVGDNKHKPSPQSSAYGAAGSPKNLEQSNEHTH